MDKQYNPVKVLIVDSSAEFRQLLVNMIESDYRCKVVGLAENAYQAREKIKSLKPDVITLDIPLQGMNGLEFLKRIMKLRPMPVVIVSALATENAAITSMAVKFGAADILQKPIESSPSAKKRYAANLCKKLVRVCKNWVRDADDHQTASSRLTKNNSKEIISIGASTGGIVALEVVLSSLPSCTPGVVVVQHIHGPFLQSLVKNLNSKCTVKVKSATDDEIVRDGHVYLAPADHHLRIKKAGSFFKCVVRSGTPVSSHLPSVDVLFDSVATEAGGNALAVLLTGMGKDGANGLLKIQQAGSATIVQDEETSVVWGMPGTAYRLGAADEVCALDKIGSKVCQYFGLDDTPAFIAPTGS